MKNIHLIPTNKPSRLMIDTIENKLYFQPILHEKTINVLPQHIYITNDERVNEVDYYIKGDEPFLAVWVPVSHRCKKVIMTTDQELIKDGVQPIDNEFLEWFVKNPSCESVEVEDTCLEVRVCDCAMNENCLKPGYTIIIPQEEPKQEYQSECICDTECRGFVNVKCKNLNKQETLEEAAHNYFIRGQLGFEKAADTATAFLRGGLWQAERRYSEEDMIEFGKYLLQLSNSAMSRKFNMKMLDSETGIKLTKDLFEQFKKK